MGLEQLEAKRKDLIRKIATLQSTIEDLDDPTSILENIKQLQNKLAQVEKEIIAAGGQATRHYGAGAVHIENSEVQGTINTGTIITSGDFVGRDKQEETYHAPVYGGSGNTFNFGTPPPPTTPDLTTADLPPIPPRLREKIMQNLSESELSGICFDLKIDYDHLDGRNYHDRVISLIKHCQRRNMVEQLINACQKANHLGQWS
jgi:hypothetical protein